MTRALSRIGIWTTVTYLAFALWLFWPKLDAIRTLEPNNIGDILAGAFGPLAIVWLVLGFFQQGIELRQNTKALELQADELKNSVSQQQELARVANEQLMSQRQAYEEEKEKSAAASTPRFLFVPKGSTSNGAGVRYHFAMVNTGASAARVRLQPSDPLLEVSQTLITVFEPYGERSVDVVFLDRTARPGFSVEVTCVNALGSWYSWIYDLHVDATGKLAEIEARAA